MKVCFLHAQGNVRYGNVPPRKAKDDHSLARKHEKWSKLLQRSVMDRSGSAMEGLHVVLEHTQRVIDGYSLRIKSYNGLNLPGNGQRWS